MSNEAKKSLVKVRLQHLLKKVIFISIILLIAGVIAFWRVNLNKRGFCRLELNKEKTEYTVVEAQERKEIKIPSEYRGRPVVAIGKGALSNNDKLEKLIIPDSVKEVGDQAFAFSLNLKQVVIGDGVTSIGAKAFEGTAVSKDENNWQDDVLYIGNHLIRARNEDKTEYTIKEGTVCIADEAFKGFKKVENINLPQSLTHIGKYAFNDSSLKTIRMYDSVVGIDEYAFSNCDRLTSIVLSNKLSKISKGVFLGCDYLTYVGVSEGVMVVEEDAFRRCSRLETIYLPNSLETISKYAFDGCNRLTTVYLGKSLRLIDECAFGWTSIDNVYFSGSVEDLYKIDVKSGFDEYNLYINNTPVTNLVIPGTVVEVNDFFSGCKTLTSVVISDGVTTIASRAFKGCENLVSVTIGTTVTKLGVSVFGECEKLKSITFEDTNGWYADNENSVFEPKAMDVTNPEQNVMLFATNNNYYYWYKS